MYEEQYPEIFAACEQCQQPDWLHQDGSTEFESWICEDCSNLNAEVESAEHTAGWRI